MNRERFPGLSDGWSRLDGPAGTLMVDRAIDAMADWMRSPSGANSHGQFKAAGETDTLVDSTRETVARLLGGAARDVVFGPSMTGVTMRFSATVARTWSAGDQVVVTRLDHDANVRPWVIAAKRAGCEVRYAEPDAGTLELPASAVESHLTRRTRWVAVTAASNACGTIPDLPGIVAAAHAVGAQVYVDAVHATPHRRMDLGELGADVIACSAYKWFGPHVGMLCARRGVLDDLWPDKLNPSPDSLPDRFELGTLPFESLAGVRAAAEYVLEVGYDAIRAHEQPLAEAALAGLDAIDGVTVYGHAADRAPTLMFNVAGHTSAEVAKALADRQVAVWDGNYYAWELERHTDLAPHGAVRAGFVHYNDESDVERLLDGVRAVAGA